MSETTSSTAAPVGHGSIRLRHSDPQPEAGVPAAAEPTPALAVRQVGHGTIRLRVRSPAASTEADAPSPAAAAAEHVPAQVAAIEPAPAPEPEPIGHGPVRFVHRSLELPIEATLAAEADILELLSTVS